MSANSRISWVFWGLIAGALLATSAANAINPQNSREILEFDSYRILHSGRAFMSAPQWRRQ